MKSERAVPSTETENMADEQKRVFCIENAWNMIVFTDAVEWK